eukprot:6479615-Amphidinium_carterae.1
MVGSPRLRVQVLSNTQTKLTLNCALNIQSPSVWRVSVSRSSCKLGEDGRGMRKRLQGAIVPNVIYSPLHPPPPYSPHEVMQQPTCPFPLPLPYAKSSKSQSFGSKQFWDENCRSPGDGTIPDAWSRMTMSTIIMSLGH